MYIVFKFKATAPNLKLIFHKRIITRTLTFAYPSQKKTVNSFAVRFINNGEEVWRFRVEPRATQNLNMHDKPLLIDRTKQSLEWANVFTVLTVVRLEELKMLKVYRRTNIYLYFIWLLTIIRTSLAERGRLHDHIQGCILNMQNTIFGLSSIFV